MTDSPDHHNTTREKRNTLEQRPLGRQGLEVGQIGLGCMGFSSAYGIADEAESIATIREAFASGVTLFDTADVYGGSQNETLLGTAIRPMRDSVTIATKFGNIRQPGGGSKIDGTPAHVHQACDASLKRLQVDSIDLYFQHRVDPTVPIEETVGAMSELVAAGKVRYIGLSEAGVETIKRAHSVAPISAVETEYSLWTRDVERRVLPTLRELGIGLVAYSPLGRGFLTGAVRDRQNLHEQDSRRRHPRFTDGNLQHNLNLLDSIEAIAAQYSVTTAQVSLAWILSQGEDVVPIPGTTKRTHLRENLATATIELSPVDLKVLDDMLLAYEVAGERYPSHMMGRLET